MSSNIACDQDFCRGGIQCCQLMADGITRYCKVASQCHNLPKWEIILIPVLLGLAALIIGLLIFFKLRKRSRRKFNVNYFSHQQIRVKPTPTMMETHNNTYTTLRSEYAPGKK